MANSEKASITYFKYDVDMNSDDKIEFLLAEYGLVGKAIVVELFTKIYSSKGYYIEWNERIEKLFVKKLYIDQDLFTDVLNYALENNIFDINLYQKYGILTSRRIQKDYIEAVKYKKEVNFISEYLLVRKKKLYDCLIRKSQNVVIVNLDGDILEILDYETKEKNEPNDDEVSSETDQVRYETDLTKPETDFSNKTQDQNKKSNDFAQKKQDPEAQLNISKPILTNLNLHWEKNPDLFFKKHVFDLYPKGKTRSLQTEKKFMEKELPDWKEHLATMHQAVVAQNKKREYETKRSGVNQDRYASQFRRWIKEREFEIIPEFEEDFNDEPILKYDGPPKNHDSTPDWEKELIRKQNAGELP